MFREKPQDVVILMMIVMMILYMGTKTDNIKAMFAMKHQSVVGTLVEVVKNISFVVREVIGGYLCPRNRGHIKGLESSQSGGNNLAAGGKDAVESSEYALDINSRNADKKAGGNEAHRVDGLQIDNIEDWINAGAKPNSVIMDSEDFEEDLEHHETVDGFDLQWIEYLSSVQINNNLKLVQYI